MKALIPMVFRKGYQLADRWTKMMEDPKQEGAPIDVAHWVSRATFDVIGLAGL